MKNEKESLLWWIPKTWAFSSPSSDAYKYYIFKQSKFRSSRGDKTQIENYRLTGILSTFAKVFGSIIYTYMYVLQYKIILSHRIKMDSFVNVQRQLI